jgi:ribosome-binding protein aMBF1 (putative translation factor)
LGLSYFGLKIGLRFDGRDDALAKKSVFTTRYQTLKTLLIEARRDAGLTQVELAAKLSRPQSFVSKYERGERRLDLVEFLEVADALGLQPAQFIKKLK